MSHFCIRTHTPRTILKRQQPTPLHVAKPRRTPTRDEIARLAYSYWEARGRQGGSAETDWLRAEQELARRSAES